GVARLAGREAERLPLRRRAGVALVAGRRRVLAGEREPREAVIEAVAVERRPRRGGVALVARGGEPAGGRVPVGTRPGPRHPAELGLALRRALGMALQAADLRVAAVERPAGERVIELLHRAARPADQPRVATDVLDVALLAWLAAVLPPVQAASRGELAAEILVAVEAQPRDD